MKTQWLKAALVLSLLLNCIVAGVLAHRFFVADGSVEPEANLQEQLIQEKVLPPPVRAQRKGFGREIRAE